MDSDAECRIASLDLEDISNNCKTENHLAVQTNELNPLFKCYLVFANGTGDLGSIPGCVIPKTLKMVLDTS